MARANFFKQHGRLLSFFAVLAITSTLVLVLFDEARAVEISGAGPASVARTSAQVSLIFTISIPDDQRLPIDGLAVYLEETETDEKDSPTLVATATCDAVCSSLSTSGAKASGILTVELLETDTQASYDYDYLAVNKPDYGYSPTAGYGYGTGTLGGTLVAEGDGYGYGYGADGDSELAYKVTLSPSALGLGHYWVTFVVETGSGTIGDISSAAKYLRVRAPTAPVADDEVPPTPTPSTPPVTTPTPPTTPPASPPVSLPPQAIENGFRGTATVTPGAGQQTVSFNVSGFPGLRQIQLETEGGEPITLTVEQTSTRPTGTPGLPSGFAPGSRYLHIDVQGGDGSNTDGEIQFTVNATELQGHEPHGVTLLHYTSDRWVPEPTQFIGDDVYIGRFTSLSPFAITFDNTAPTVGALTPVEGAVVGVKSAIGAAFSDNRGIDTTLTTLFVDGQKVAATVTNTGAYYTPIAALLEGVHTATLTVTDLSGQQTVEEWTFTAKSDAPIVTSPTTVPTTQPTTQPTTTSPTSAPTGPTSAPTSATPEDKGAPGFEVVALLAALGAALLVLRRRKA